MPEQTPTPRLTIGFATHHDFHGAYFTLQALRMYHGEAIRECEFLVVDQTETGNAHQVDTKNLVGHLVGDVARARYFNLPEPKGTSFSRQKVFELAETPFVLCIDSHVLLAPGAVRKLLNYYLERPDCDDLIQGPMLYDDLKNFASHMAPVWRSEMFGTWDSDRYFDDLSADPKEIPLHGLGLFSARRETWLRLGGFNPAFQAFGGEEGYIHQKFRNAGYKTLCLPWLRWLHRFGRPDGPKYPLTRQDKVRNYIIGWREVGGTVDDVRKHFCTQRTSPDGPGLEHPMAEAEFNQILQDVVAGRPPHWRPTAGQAPAASGCGGGCGGSRQLPPEGATIDEILSFLKGIPRDLDQHLDTIKEYASRCDHVTEFSGRRESAAALLAGRPRMMFSHNAEEGDGIFKRLHAAAKVEIDKHQGQPNGKGKADKGQRWTHSFSTNRNDSLAVEIEETDLLFLDTQHNAERLWAEISRHIDNVRRYLIIHDTKLYGEKGDNGGAGLLPALRRLVRENPEWAVVYHTDKQYGLTVLSRSTKDRPKLPSLPRMALNYAEAMAKHREAVEMAKALPENQGKPVELLDMAPEELVNLRLDTCSLCPQRTGQPENPRCSVCGCFLVEGPKPIGGPGKALLKSQECPLGFWGQSEKAGGPVMPLLSTEDAAAK